MKVKTILFDLDGTLLNTLGDLRNSVNFALQKRGYPARTLEEVRRFVGNGVGNLMARAVPAGTREEEVAACLAEFKAHYGANMTAETVPYPGMAELLSRLKEHGVQTAVLSNKFDAATKMLCRLYFDDRIDLALGEREGVPRKPDPSVVEEALRALGASREETVYIGDSETDVRTAKHAGVFCIAVTWGFRSRAVLAAEAPGKIVDTWEELMDFLEV